MEKNNRKPPRFVRPGALAQLVRVQKNVQVCSSSHTRVNNVPAMMPKSNNMYTKTLCQIFAQKRSRDEESNKSGVGFLNSRRENNDSDLLNLPKDLLMRIIMNLRHTELQPLMQACIRLRHASLAANVVHFNYMTPEPSRSLQTHSVLPRSPPREYLAAAERAVRAASRAPRRATRQRRRYAPSVSPGSIASSSAHQTEALECGGGRCLSFTYSSEGNDSHEI
mmetsp:Transcript_15134/g.20886  ORF Transcript_15134/g.20886 Transcript_15134/m.20886 type:complete len:223 (+) Transcript_15134:201-869(+)